MASYTRSLHKCCSTQTVTPPCCPVSLTYADVTYRPFPIHSPDSRSVLAHVIFSRSDPDDAPDFNAEERTDTSRQAQASRD